MRLIITDITYDVNTSPTPTDWWMVVFTGISIVLTIWAIMTAIGNAKKAGEIAETANKIAQTANRIAKESHDFTIEVTKRDIRRTFIQAVQVSIAEYYNLARTRDNKPYYGLDTIPMAMSIGEDSAERLLQWFSDAYNEVKTIQEGKNRGFAVLNLEGQFNLMLYRWMYNPKEVDYTKFDTSQFK